MIIDGFNESFHFREEGVGPRATAAESEDSLGEEGEGTEYGDTKSLLGQCFEGVEEDFHHFLQQPQEGGRHRGLATLGADPVKYLQLGAGENLFVGPIL